jgi:thiol-disulfide isomerase/thioredoxin
MMKFLLIALLIPFFAQAETPEYCKSGEDFVLPICQDQVSWMNQAVDKVQKNNGALIVMAGATWCPYTKSFIDATEEIDSMPAGVTYYGVGVNHWHNRQKTRVQSGVDAINALIAAANSDQVYSDVVKGYPSVFIYKPGNNTLTRLDNSKMFVEDKGYDSELIYSEFAKAAQ